MKRNSKGQFKSLDLENQTINGITLLEKTDKRKRGAVLWKCRCFCGNIFYAEAYRIKNGEISSCGCKRKVFRKDNYKKERKELKKGFQERTFINLISNNKVRKNNKSGVTGITIRKNKYSTSYIVRICVKGQNIRVGTYRDLESAIKARKEAEDKYFKPIIDKYERR